MRSFRAWHFILLSLAALCIANGALAKEAKSELSCVDEVCFEKKQIISEREYLLQATTLYRYFGFRIYTAALYRTQDQMGEEWSSGGTLLKLHYHRGLEAQDFEKSSEKILKKGSEENLVRYREPLTRLYKLFQQVEEGDEYWMELTPGGEFTLSFNGKPQGTFLEPGFGSFYMGIWLGEVSIDGDHRDRLLSRKEGAG